MSDRELSDDELEVMELGFGMHASEAVGEAGQALIDALRAARQRAREAEAELREPRWYFDDGEWVDPDDKAAELPPGSAFRLDGARPTGTHYFRADALGSNEITEAEYTAALAAAESAAATGTGAGEGKS